MYYSFHPFAKTELNESVNYYEERRDGLGIEYLKHIKDNDLNLSDKLWQRNYYEHIIRDENELEQIRTYIVNNPIKWNEDNDNPENIDNNNHSLQQISYNNAR